MLANWLWPAVADFIYLAIMLHIWPTITTFSTTQIFYMFLQGFWQDRKFCICVEGNVMSGENAPKRICRDFPND